MLKKLLSLLLYVGYCLPVFAQPFAPRGKVCFGIFDAHRNRITEHSKGYRVQMACIQGRFQKAALSVPVTEKGFYTCNEYVRAGTPVEMLIVRLATKDTMQVIADHSVDSIFFVAGKYDLTGRGSLILSMYPQNGTTITNRSWDQFKIPVKSPFPAIRRRRYYHLDSAEYSFRNDTTFEYIGYQKDSLLMKEHYGPQPNIHLTTIVYNPRVSPNLYTIGNSRDDGGPLYQYLLESRDTGKTWEIKFLITEEACRLYIFEKDEFIFCEGHGSYILNRYNQHGKFIGRAVVDKEPCYVPGNMLCDNKSKYQLLLSKGMEMSDLTAARVAFSASDYNAAFYSKKGQLISLYGDGRPEKVAISEDSGTSWKEILHLKTDEWYVFLTTRENKVVLLGYAYTLVSHDFGKTWTYYNTGLFQGDDWKFIWYDDKTLLNLSNEYTDIIIVE